MHYIALEKDTNANIGILLVKNLTNVTYLRENVLDGKLNVCLVKPALIASTLQIAVAANKAAISQNSGTLTTKSLNSELLFNLSPSKNISHSLQTFGVHEKDDACFVVTFNLDEKEIRSIKSEIQGTFVDISELCNLTDEKLIKKTFKISDEELKTSTLANSVISRIAVKELDLAR